MSDCPYTGKTLIEKRELPPLPPTLGKIWELSDRKKKGFLDKQDFLLAYQLIEMYRRGEVLPDEVVNISQPYYSENKVYYFQLPSDLLGEKIPGVSLQAVSQTEAQSKATASGGESGKLSLLPPTLLDKIWELSDLNKKEFLDKLDFLVAFQLIEKCQRGEVLPTAQEVEEKRRICDFDLCSECAKKNSEAGSNNVCDRGHQLHPITVNADVWICDGNECGYEWSPDQEVDQEFVVWRCKYDKRMISLLEKREISPAY